MFQLPFVCIIDVCNYNYSILVNLIACVSHNFVCQAIMADTLENLADSSSYAVLQEKLEKLKADYTVSFLPLIIMPSSLNYSKWIEP